MRITIISKELKNVTIPKEDRDTTAYVVTYKVGKDIGIVQLLDCDEELFEEKWWKAKKEIKKAIETNFDDYVTDIELTKEDFEETESTP